MLIDFYPCGFAAFVEFNSCRIAINCAAPSFEKNGAAIPSNWGTTGKSISAASIPDRGDETGRLVVRPNRISVFYNFNLGCLKLRRALHAALKAAPHFHPDSDGTQGDDFLFREEYPWCRWMGFRASEVRDEPCAPPEQHGGQLGEPL